MCSYSGGQALLHANGAVNASQPQTSKLSGMGLGECACTDQGACNQQCACSQRAAAPRRDSASGQTSMHACKPACTQSHEQARHCSFYPHTGCDACKHACAPCPTTPRMVQRGSTWLSSRPLDASTPSRRVVMVCTWLTTSLCMTGFRLTLRPQTGQLRAGLP